MKKIKNNKKLLYFAGAFLSLLLICCCLTVLTTTFFFAPQTKEIDDVIDNTQDLENYTMKGEIYIRFDEIEGEELWVDLKFDKLVDGEKSLIKFHFDSTDYESKSYFYQEEGDIWGRIDYEDNELDTRWIKIDSMEEYDRTFQRDENTIVNSISDESKIFDFIDDNFDNKYTQENRFDDEFDLTIIDDEVMLDWFNIMFENSQNEDLDVDPTDNVNANFSTNNDLLSRFTLYTRDYKFTFEEQSFTENLTMDIDHTFKIEDVNNTQIDRPRLPNSRY
jgi:hypothetical protein